MLFADKVIDTPDGRFSYSETESGSSSLPTRLVLHSLLTDRTAFDMVADSMGGRIINLDLPGFGATDPTAAAIDDYAGSVAAFIERAGLDPAGLTLIGNGLGAFVALGTAIHRREAMARLLLIGCGARFPEPAKEGFSVMIRAAETGGMDAVVPVALRRIFTEQFLAKNPLIADERAAILRKTDPVAFVTACRALQSMDYSNLASAVTVPTLIMVGEDDQATPPDLARELHELIPGSSLTILPGIAHAPQLQDPGGFSDAVRGFLEGQ